MVSRPNGGLVSVRSYLPLVAALAILVAGCSKSDTSDSASPTPAPSDTVAASTTATASTTAAASMTAGAAATATATVAFTDIAGNINAPGITALARLGALDATSGSFMPDAPVKRRDFVRWLFKANNAIYATTPSKVIHPGTSDETPTFKDVPTSDPDYAFIQGMSDSGNSVGFPDMTFKGDDPITREQAVAIKAVLDRGAPYAGLVGAKNVDYTRGTLPAWKDKDDVSVTYIAAISEDTGNEGANNVDNIGRTFGSIAVFRPKKTLSRGEAATMFTVIGDRTVTGMRSAADALAAAPSATP